MEKKRVISQEAFEEVVRENIEDLGMDPGEALQDAIETLSLQGVDLSGIITTQPHSSSSSSSSSSDPHPVLRSLQQLNTLASEDDPNLVGSLLDDLIRQVQGSDDGVSNAAAIATCNGGVEILTAVCSNLAESGNYKVKTSGLKAVCCLLHDVASREVFERCGGPAVVIGILEKHLEEEEEEEESEEVQNACFGVIAAAAAGTEILKESWVNLKVDEFILKALNQSHSSSSSSSQAVEVYDAIRVLLTSDDNRVAASQVFGFARRFAKIGIADAVVRGMKSTASLLPPCLALKSLAVNDEICRSVAEKGAIDAIFRCIDQTADRSQKPIALASCSLLSKLAGSDQNKNTIVEKRGIDKLIALSARFADDPSVIQEVMYIISVLCLRSPDNASRSMEAGAGDLAVQSMQKFPAAQLLQRNACFMIRNLVVRNPENRKLLLDNRIEKIIRKAKESHKNCRAAATDALRDLGLANYND